MVRPVKGDVRSILMQQREAERVKEKMVKAHPLPPGTTMVHDEIQVPATTPPEEIARLARIFQNDPAVDPIVAAQEKDAQHRTEVQAGWIVSDEPQFVHTTCGNLAVIVRPRQAPWDASLKELFCRHCKVVPHVLNIQRPNTES